LIIDRETETALLIDCPPRGVKVAIQALRDFGDPAVVGAIITHWDLDHYGGLLGVAAASDCHTLYYNRDTILSYPEDNTKRRAALLELIEEPYISMRQKSAQQGEEGQLGVFKWKLLAPSHLDLTRAVVTFERNLCSGVLRGEAHGISIVVGGDADGRVWQRIISEGEELRADILRWPHHGAEISRSGMTASTLLDSTRPKFIVISVGTTNQYGHPNLATVELAAQHSRMGCTQVTHRCHGLLDGRVAVPCGGTLSFRLKEDGSIETWGGWQRHDEVVDGWEKPMCR
jgi:competence protein ComEC